MLNSPHPHDERLSAVASDDDEATADVDLRAHVDACGRCAGVVAELRSLRVSLAELPDVAPSRSLRLVPPVAEPRAGASAGAWLRRLFAPALTAGAALAMVGLVGTAAPALEGMAGGPESGEQAGGDAESEAVIEGADQPAPFSATDAPAAGDDGARDDFSAHESDDGERPVADSLATRDLPAERSPWPMVLFGGVSLVIGILLLRWILVPRAG